jgi:DNA-binding NarL/FixJ family response regulator
MGYVKPPKKEWSKVLKDGTVSINATTIARGLNISPDRVRTRVANILKKLRTELA